MASQFSIWLDKVTVHYTNCRNDEDSKDELKKSFYSQDIPYRFPPPFSISISISQLILFNIFSKGHRFFVIDIKEKKDAEGSVSSSPKED